MVRLRRHTADAGLNSGVVRAEVLDPSRGYPQRILSPSRSAPKILKLLGNVYNRTDKKLTQAEISLIPQ